MQKIFCFWWIHTSRAWLFGCSKSLQSPLILIYLVLSNRVKEKVLCFTFHFRMYFFPSALLISVSASFLSCSCLEISFELTHKLKSTKGGLFLLPRLVWISMLVVFYTQTQRVSYKQTMNLTPFFFATDWYITVQVVMIHVTLILQLYQGPLTESRLSSAVHKHKIVMSSSSNVQYNNLKVFLKKHGNPLFQQIDLESWSTWLT